MNKEYIKATEDFIDFVHENPTTYHSVKAFGKMLGEKGYRELREDEPFKVEKGGRYFVSRNGSALIAFRIPSDSFDSYSIVSAHTDSPCFKIKHSSEILGDYTTLNTEVYGGLLLSTWFDRPLSAAGRVLLKNGKEVETKLVNFDRDLLQIVSLAIHQNRRANEGICYNVQKELMPIIGLGKNEDALMELLAKELKVEKNDILDFDLFVYSRAKGSIWGMNQEFFSAPRIDDLECAYTAVRGLMDAEEGSTLPVLALFDNEEVGSGTKQGALSDFLISILSRIENALSIDVERHECLKAKSLMLSADNAHARHPNYPETSDVTNKVLVNGGIVIKYASNQKYSTDGHSAARLRMLLEENDIPYQVFFNNSNLPGGSTLGNLSLQKYSLESVDIGAAQLAMHSVYETAGTSDVVLFTKLFNKFFSR
jgi:Aspartyl aminopeptidase